MRNEVIVTAVVGKAFRLMLSVTEPGFEVERLGDGRVIVFVPGAPDAWSGALVIMDADRVTPLDLEMRQVARLAKNLGKGTAAALGDPPERAASS